MTRGLGGSLLPYRVRDFHSLFLASFPGAQPDFILASTDLFWIAVVAMGISGATMVTFGVSTQTYYENNGFLRAHSTRDDINSIVSGTMITI